MTHALTMAEVGMLNDVQRLQVIANNLANVGTLGFKKEVAVARPFHAVFDSALSAPVDLGSGPRMLQMTDFSEGAMTYTGNPLDVAIEGGGFLVVGTPWGEALTRQGSLQLDATGRLVTAAGYPVLGVGGEIQLSTSVPQIDESGNIRDSADIVAQLQRVKVEDPTSLIKLGDGLFQASATTEVLPGDDVRVRQGYAEAANVVAMQEMIKLIETVRHFETSQRLVLGYDNMMDRAINVAGEL